MKPRTWLGVVLAALSIGPIGLAATGHAEPYAGVVQTATFSIRVIGTDRKPHDVVIQATKIQGGSATPQAAWVTVQLATCKGHICGAPAQYSKTIDPAAFTVEPDASSASLETTFAGAPLKLTWTGSVTDVLVAAGPGSQAAVGARSNATASAQFLGISCSGAGQIQSVAQVTDSGPEASGAAEPKRIPKAFKPVRGRVAKCAR